MSEFKGTPGPWFFAGKHNDCECRYVCTDKVNLSFNEVCTLYGSEGDEQQANANLIAAAPDLLEALQAIYADYKQLADSGDAVFWKLEETIVGRQALTAIAKALGE